MSLLETIQDPSQLKDLTHEQDLQLCQAIRSFLIENVKKTGGHLASNLGVVELTLALEKTFDLSRDRLVFDVGHQCYVHKILTGRMDDFDRLRAFHGIAGFPKPSESQYDAFVATLTKELNQKLWDSVELVDDENITTTGFMEVYEKYFHS